jgi:hypothetical protein
MWDEVLGRKNFVANVVYRKYAATNDAKKDFLATMIIIISEIDRF